jgi:uncharacterized membrane protein
MTMKSLPILIGIVAAIALVGINFMTISHVSRVLAFSGAILILSVVFLGLVLVNKSYSGLKGKIGQIYVIAATYLAIAGVMVFGGLGYNLFSVEWALLGFLLGSMFFYDFRIDSRFMILPAILLLGYVPFLLIGKYDALAETTAVYVYYFLVCGVVLQIMEYFGEKKGMFDFDNLIDYVKKKKSLISVILIIIGFIVIDFSLINRIKNLELLKWTSVYLFIVVFVFYVISSAKEEPTQHKR